MGFKSYTYFNLGTCCYFRDKFRNGYDSFKRAFQNIDKNMDGSVSKEEFIQVLNYFHYYIDGVELDKLLIRLLFIYYFNPKQIYIIFGNHILVILFYITKQFFPNFSWWDKDLVTLSTEADLEG